MGNAGVGDGEGMEEGYNVGEGVDMGECVGVREGMGDEVAVLPVVIDAVASVVSAALIDFAAANETNNHR